jgi:hypothetical protein
VSLCQTLLFFIAMMMRAQQGFQSSLVFLIGINSIKISENV